MALINIQNVVQDIENLTAEGLNKAGALVLRDAKINCPVQTGNLRRSITKTNANAYDLSVAIFTNVEYAPFVEAGTEKQEAEPFLMPALEKNRTEILRCFENLF